MGSGRESVYASGPMHAAFLRELASRGGHGGYFRVLDEREWEDQARAGVGVEERVFGVLVFGCCGEVSSYGLTSPEEARTFWEWSCPVCGEVSPEGYVEGVVGAGLQMSLEGMSREDRKWILEEANRLWSESELRGMELGEFRREESVRRRGELN